MSDTGIYDWEDDEELCTSEEEYELYAATDELYEWIESFAATSELGVTLGGDVKVNVGWINVHDIPSQIRHLFADKSDIERMEATHG